MAVGIRNKLLRLKGAPVLDTGERRHSRKKTRTVRSCYKDGTVRFDHLFQLRKQLVRMRHMLDHFSGQNDVKRPRLKGQGLKGSIDPEQVAFFKLEFSIGQKIKLEVQRNHLVVQLRKRQAEIALGAADVQNFQFPRLFPQPALISG